MNRIEIPGHDAIGIRADNPGPFSLTGTNTWIVGREPAWLIDPGPDLPDHLDAISAEVDARGGLGAILLTHDHHDHSDAVAEMTRRFSPVPLAAARGTGPAAPGAAASDPAAPGAAAAAAAPESAAADASPTHGPPARIVLHDGDQIGPLQVIAVPGHAPDHIVFLTADGIAFTGDAVLGQGSVFVAADMGPYLDGLARVRERGPRIIAPGHGPLVTDADAKLGEYIEHRLAREAHLRRALDAGLRSVDQLLDEVWADAPEHLRIAAGWTLAAHLDKLEAEGALPGGVQRPERPADLPAI